MRQGYRSYGWTEEGLNRRQRALDEHLCMNCGNPLTGRKIFYCDGYCSSQAYEKYWKADNWQKIRKMVFKRDNFTCVKCGIAPAEEVDHIVEIAIGGDEFDPDNCQSLCKPCHKKKTAKFLGKRFSLQN